MFLLVMCLAGCGESVELHSQLSEQEANEVIAELADKQVHSQKIPTKNGVSVRVSAQDISRAIKTLAAAGLPKATRSTLGQIFRKEESFLLRWKSVPATSTPCHRNSKPRCQT